LSVKPLLKKDIKEFLYRFDNFLGANIKDISVIDSTTIEMSLEAQDRALGFDWVELTLSFSGVSDARLVDNSKLEFLDMSEGIALRADSSFEFAIGSYTDIKSASCFIVATSLKVMV